MGSGGNWETLSKLEDSHCAKQQSVLAELEKAWSLIAYSNPSKEGLKHLQTTIPPLTL